MVTHSKIVDPLYVHFRKYIFNNVLTNLSFMAFLFHVPFFCTAAAVTEILTVFEFRERKKLILNQFPDFGRS
jgi:hypothetical protein